MANITAIMTQTQKKYNIESQCPRTDQIHRFVYIVQYKIGCKIYKIDSMLADLLSIKPEIALKRWIKKVSALNNNLVNLVFSFLFRLSKCNA